MNQTITCPTCQGKDQGFYVCPKCKGTKTITEWVAEPPPKTNELPSMWDLVRKDMADRDTFGRQKYGTPLQPFNGRNALKDAYEEVLDLAVYLRQAIYEKEGK